MAYQIIGETHDQADELEAFLHTLGYSDKAGGWRHPRRHAIFVGDFVNRAPAQVRSVEIAWRMVDAGAASPVMGNHELNAITLHTPDPRHPGDDVRPHEWAHAATRIETKNAAFLHQAANARNEDNFRLQLIAEGHRGGASPVKAAAAEWKRQRR